MAAGFVWVIVAVTKNDCREITGLTRREIKPLLFAKRPFLQKAYLQAN